jgi:ABC-type transporter Mla subunit MlaD
MSDAFRPVFDAIKESTIAFVEASEANARAGRALGKLADAAMQAREEHEDLRETVARLETLVRDLIRRSAPPS